MANAMSRLGFIGLGAMGWPMAGHLAEAGHELLVHNRSSAKAMAWAKAHGGRPCESVAQLAGEVEAIFTCVGADRDLEAVCAAALPRLRPGTIWVDHTTTSADLARRLSGELLSHGCAFLDAPVSGGQAGAQAGRLTIMAGGEEATLDAARAWISTYAAAIVRIGPSGSGQLAKMVNQICIAGAVQGVAEGLAFAERAGLDCEAVFAAISKGAAQSWQMDNRWASMLAGRFDFGFAVDWMRKDLGLMLEEARRNGASVPIAALIDQFYAEVQGQGGHRWDTSSLIERLRDRHRDPREE